MICPLVAKFGLYMGYMGLYSVSRVSSCLVNPTFVFIISFSSITHLHWFLKCLTACRCLIIVVVTRVRWYGRGEGKEQERESLDDHTLALLAKDPYTFQIDLGSRGARETAVAWVLVVLSVCW